MKDDVELTEISVRRIVMLRLSKFDADLLGKGTQEIDSENGNGKIDKSVLNVLGIDEIDPPKNLKYLGKFYNIEDRRIAISFVRLHSV